MSGRVVLVLSGPSGVGKSSIIRSLVDRGDCVLSVSATTRDPRGEEQDGVHYQFLTEEAFRARVDAGEFLEWAQVHGNLYGTLTATVRDQLATDKHVILDIDVQGGAQLRDRPGLPLVSVFIEPPSLEELRNRLEGRGDTEPEQVEKRLNTAVTELEQAHLYDHQVVNDHLESAVAQVVGILEQGA